MMGGALGLAVLPAWRRRTRAICARPGVLALAALNGGYHVAFLIGAVFAFAAAAIGASVLRADVQAHAGHEPAGQLATDSD